MTNLQGQQIGTNCTFLRLVTYSSLRNFPLTQTAVDSVTVAAQDTFRSVQYSRAACTRPYLFKNQMSHDFYGTPYQSSDSKLWINKIKLHSKIHSTLCQWAVMLS